jgi:hypothetical protein
VPRRLSRHDADIPNGIGQQPARHGSTENRQADWPGTYLDGRSQA